MIKCIEKLFDLCFGFLKRIIEVVASTMIALLIQNRMKEVSLYGLMYIVLLNAVWND